MTQTTTARFITDGTYSIEQARRRLESEGVLSPAEEGGWKFVSDDPTFPTVFFLPNGLIELHGHGLQDHQRRHDLAAQLSKLLGVGVQPVGEV